MWRGYGGRGYGGEAMYYDLCLNSSKIGIEECVQLIYNVASTW